MIKVIIIKTIILFLIFIISIVIGLAISSKYKYRVEELREIKSAMNMIKTKITYTYEPLPDIFLEIANHFNRANSEIYLKYQR